MGQSLSRTRATNCRLKLPPQLESDVFHRLSADPGFPGDVDIELLKPYFITFPLFSAEASFFVRDSIIEGCRQAIRTLRLAYDSFTEPESPAAALGLGDVPTRRDIVMGSVKIPRETVTAHRQHVPSSRLPIASHGVALMRKCALPSTSLLRIRPVRPSPPRTVWSCATTDSSPTLTSPSAAVFAGWRSHIDIYPAAFSVSDGAQRFLRETVTLAISSRGQTDAHFRRPPKRNALAVLRVAALCSNEGAL